MRTWDVPHSVLGTLSLSNLNRADQKGNLICKTEKVAYLPREEEGHNVTINIDFLFMNTLHHEIVGLYCRGKRFSVAGANVKNST